MLDLGRQTAGLVMVVEERPDGRHRLVDCDLIDRDSEGGMVGSDSRIGVGIARMAYKAPRSPSDAFSGWGIHEPSRPE